MEKQTGGGRLNRRQDILDAAAKYFKERGYASTSMRDIAGRAKVKTASLYYHFPSKAELLFAVYEESAIQLSGKVVDAIRDHDDPWERLEIACAVHLRSLLEGSDYVQVVFSDVPNNIDKSLRRRLTAQRDEYEKVFREIIAAVPVRSTVSSKYLLLGLLGAMAWTRVWYKPGGDTPEEIARHMVALFREGCDSRSYA